MKDFVGLFLTVVFGSGSAIAITRFIFDARKERRERSGAITYLALQLAFQFEGFVMECARSASRNQDAQENEGHVGSYISGVPTPQPLPVSDAYRFLHPDILNRVFGFSQLCQLAQQSASFWYEYVGDRDCYENAAEENTVRMGAEALDIARAMRVKYKLGDRRLEFDNWNIDDFICKELAKAKERKARLDKTDAQ